VQIGFRLISKHDIKGRSIIPVIGKLYKSLNHKNIFHVNSGNWYGNDTIWRTIVDLNNILLYADKTGSLQESIQRKYLAMVDGIIAGEGEGPMTPTDKTCGLLIGGFDPFSVDKLSASLMGFDWKKIPQICNGVKIFSSTIKSESAKADYNIKNFRFLPPSGWEGHVELKDHESK